MIRAFAMDPRLVAKAAGSRRDLAMLVADVGLAKPRVLFAAPTRTQWRAESMKALAREPLGDVERKRAEEVVRLLVEGCVRRQIQPAAALSTWRAASMRAREQQYVDAIVVADEGAGLVDAISWDDVNAAEDPWRTETCRRIERTAEAMTTALRPFLRLAHEIHVIDPYFGPENRRHRVVLESLAAAAATAPSLPTLHVHCGDKAENSFFRAKAERLARGLPRGIRLVFHWIRERPGGERFHNRYLLTDLGGVAASDGFDAGARSQTTEFYLLARETYDARWRQFVAPGGAFETVDQIELMGGGPSV